MNSFLFVLQFRMCQSRRVHHFIGFEGICYFPEHYRFYGNRYELRDFSLTTHNSESFYLQL